MNANAVIEVFENYSTKNPTLFVYEINNKIDKVPLDSVVYDSIEMISTPFKNLETLEWNLDAEPSLQRYK